MFAHKPVADRHLYTLIAIVIAALSLVVLQLDLQTDRFVAGDKIDRAEAESVSLLSDLPTFQAFQAKIRDGDIIFRGRQKGWGNLASGLSDQDQRYGHVGVVRRKKQAVYVIHAAGDPLQSEGRVRQDSLREFLARSERSGVYRLPLDSRGITKFKSKIEYALTTRLPFDRAYSLESKTSVYCTELIWRAWAEVVQKDPVLVKTRWHKKNVLALDDLQFAQGVILIAEIDIFTH